MPHKKLTPIHHRTLIKVFEMAGFGITRVKGDHVIMTKPGIKRPLVIKTRPQEVPVTHIRTNLLTANISRDQYFELLDKVR